MKKTFSVTLFWYFGVFK